ncbi:hypothetical protein lerEdw1_003051 [Lerista edwardsae]|nr:hypothetical protein lerEdw1_003051 [Lerista edwardsae]
MELLHPLLLVLVGLSGFFAEEDLQKKSFIFPEQSNTAFVVLKDTPQKPLTSFTLCLRYYTDLTRPITLFSYATKKDDNELLLYKPSPTQYTFYLGSDSVSFQVPETKALKPGGEHVCVSWESATGIVEFWVDGVLWPRKGLKKGYAVPFEASIILGQEQDSFGGGFDANQGLVGEISDVNMWDRVLSAEEMHLVTGYRVVPNNVIDWSSLDYDAKGYVVVKPSTNLWYSGGWSQS